MIRRYMDWIKSVNLIMYKPFRGLNRWQKIIGIIIFMPIVCPIVFYKMFITKEWKPLNQE